MKYYFYFNLVFHLFDRYLSAKQVVIPRLTLMTKIAKFGPKINSRIDTKSEFCFSLMAELYNQKMSLTPDYCFPNSILFSVVMRFTKILIYFAILFTTNRIVREFLQLFRFIYFYLSHNCFKSNLISFSNI